MDSSKAKEYGAVIIPQESDGMGNARRQSIKAALDYSNFENDIVIWLEPEKCNMIPHLKYIRSIDSLSKNLFLFKRNSLNSYPREEQLFYLYGQVLSEYIFGEVIDLFFGPVAFTKKIGHYFLDYDGEYGDTWDSIHIPKIRAIASKESYIQTHVDYSHPFIQTSFESGQSSFFIKRTEQTYKLSVSYWNEAKKLKLISESA